MNAVAWSVIVPTYNRPAQLARCLTALRQLEPPDGGFEIIVVNDGGNDVGGALPGTMQESVMPRIRSLAQPRGGPAAARNAGVAAATGTWLAFTDDDCRPHAAWLRAFERALAQRPDALAGGVTTNAVSSNFFSETSQLLVGFISDWFDGRTRERMFTSNNIALARSAFLECGGFDPQFGLPAAEDREFCDRWSAQGRSSLTVPDAIVEHRHELTLRSFLRQHFAYGRAGRQFRRIRGARGRPVHIDARFYIASLRYVSRGQPPGRGMLLAGCTLAAHAAYAAGLARESLRGRRVTPELNEFAESR